MTQLQQTLNSALDELSGIFSKSLENNIKQSVQEMGVLLFQVKNTNAAQSKQGVKNAAEISQCADQILHPLMDLLDKKLTTYAEYCERTVLKRVLKQLWRIVIIAIEKRIVLPPSEKSHLLPTLPNTKIEDVSRLLKNSKLPSLNVIEVIYLVNGNINYRNEIFFILEYAKRKKFISKALFNSRRISGNDKTIFPCKWKWFEEILLGKKFRITVIEICLITLYTNY
mgnify:FL=1